MTDSISLCTHDWNECWSSLNTIINLAVNFPFRQIWVPFAHRFSIFMQYFGEEISCRSLLTRQHIKLFDSFSTTDFILSNKLMSIVEGKQKEKQTEYMQTYLHSYTCQSIAFDSSMFWPWSADTKCTSTSTLMHSAQSLFLSFIVKVTFSCRLPSCCLFVEVHPYNAQDAIPANRWREFSVQILKWKSKWISEKYRPHMQSAYFYCWHRVLANKQKKNYYRHVNLCECVSICFLQIRNQLLASWLPMILGSEPASRTDAVSKPANSLVICINYKIIHSCR